MNLLLFDPRHVLEDGRLQLGGETARHAHKILKVQPGDSLAVGALEGSIGTAVVLTSTASELTLAPPTLSEPPPRPLPVELVLALPRPKFLGRILQDVTALGVKRVHLVQTLRVEKSYWSSSLLAADALDRCLRLGLQQGRDTQLPSLSFEHRWQGVLDRLRGAETIVWVADGSASAPLSPTDPAPCVLVIGPEGGLVAPELEELAQAGARFGHLGQRILRVETAVAAALSRFL